MDVIGSAACLEDPARWLGVVIAVVGAFSANPDATAHGWARFCTRVGQVCREVRGFFARFIPWLRQSATAPSPTDTTTALSGVGTLSGRGVHGWGEDATVQQKLHVLDERTRSLDREVGELQQTLNQTGQQLRSELQESAGELRNQINGIEESSKESRREKVHTDAKGLPVAVGGLVLSGLSPDAPRVSLWVGLLLLVVAVGLAASFTWKIWQGWRAGARHRAAPIPD